jgi:hypothetical protein
MIFIEFMARLFTFDIGWLLEFVFSNLFWLFAFALLVHILFNGKHMLLGIVLIAFDIWLWDVWGSISGLSFFGATTLVIYYISKIAVLKLAETIPQLRDKFVVISTLQGLGALVIANIMA